jgi:hypothetical protein
MDETRLKSPKICFCEDSYLVYGIRRDSRATKIGDQLVARVFARSASGAADGFRKGFTHARAISIDKRGLFDHGTFAGASVRTA